MAAKLCGICTSVEHPTDMCPTLQETDTGSSRIRVDLLITSSRGDSHFGQDRFRGHMRLNNSDPYRTLIKGKQVISNRLHSTRYHLGSSNNSSREHLHKVVLHL
ncbi:hypothetical protein CR513_37421, partial [Mucuna pruriens]